MTVFSPAADRSNPVAAEVTRRTTFSLDPFRLLTSAATKRVKYPGRAHSTLRQCRFDGLLEFGSRFFLAELAAVAGEHC